MQLKVPPGIVVLAAIALLFGSVRLLPQLSVAFPGQSLLALVIGIVGLVPGVQGIVAFYRRKTTFNPMSPGEATTLVTEGIYRLSRNPMYLGLLFLLLALSVYWGTLAALVIVPGFVWYMNEFQIKPEEASLRDLFGEAYEDYLTRVRRWI
ncbi:methyltransferase family protein [Roseibium aggregatum]|uniref:Isoprenylcysteine carboxylmethyltransferase family protein n=1 Tax=Roseibium aggregatum TaxID=187304 RepID=A0A939J0X1_9HYPH|nr:isoprenylcysteine carboxylmethyltransferase family protein [Roseibium aggregatum]MBN9669733.1 isoprenylcysteine carboxylmethyltransferase family protein [Roseibium aggregatum]